MREVARCSHATGRRRLTWRRTAAALATGFTVLCLGLLSTQIGGHDDETSQITDRGHVRLTAPGLADRRLAGVAARMGLADDRDSADAVPGASGGVLGEPGAGTAGDGPADTGGPEAVGVPEQRSVAAPELPADCERGQIERTIAQYDWPCAQAIAVAGCESGYDALGRLDGWWASNGASFGLFQVNAINQYADASHTRIKPGWETFTEDWMLPERNIWYAHEVYVDWGGWGAWACRWAAW